MKICVFGAGAIGGYLAAELALAGHEVSAIVRGTHLDAIRANGLKLIMEGSEKVARIAASSNSSDFGPQDYVICTLKAHQSHQSAEQFRPLLGPDTAVVTAMNGIPWWYFYKEGGRFDGRHLESVDAGARQWTKIGPEWAIGCAVDPACEVIAPGVIEHHEFKRFTIGELDGTRSQRVKTLGDVLTGANFEAPIRDQIRWNVVTAVQELGRLTGVPTPAIDVVLPLVQECGRHAGLYGTPA